MDMVGPVIDRMVDVVLEFRESKYWNDADFILLTRDMTALAHPNRFGRDGSWDTVMTDIGTFRVMEWAFDGVRALGDLAEATMELR